jgi:prepilin-type N-terminal cleavage/methylation domain-containing protein
MGCFKHEARSAKREICTPRASACPERVSEGRFVLRAFTLPELMVSVSILLIISVAVSGQITLAKYQEELASSARVLAGTLRDLQAFAQAATGVKTCAPSGKPLVCEVSTALCAASPCGTLVTPSAVGAVFDAPYTTIQRFAEVFSSSINRRKDLGEDLGTRSFISGLAGTNFVSISSVSGDGTPGFPFTVTFERQSGSMRMNACNTPAPFTPACSGSLQESTWARITLVHSKTGKTRSVLLNAVTGKISLE